MALLDRQGIPRLFLQEDNRNLTFWNAIGSLLDFSLVSVNSSQNLFTMHRLVQIATQKWLETNQVLQSWESKAIQRLADRFPVGEYENWGTCGLLLPHAERVITYSAKGEESVLQYASLLEDTGWYLAVIGNYYSAVQKQEQSLNIRRKYLNKEDSRVSSSMANLASTYCNQGRWKEAEELQVQVMEARQRVLSEEHPDMLLSIQTRCSASRNAAQHDQPDIDILGSRTMDGGRGAGGASDRDELEGARRGASSYADQHG